MEQGARRWSHLRVRWVDAITATGLMLTINESVLRRGEPRADLLVLFAAMMGLSFTTRADDVRRRVLEQRNKDERQEEGAP